MARSLLLTYFKLLHPHYLKLTHPPSLPTKNTCQTGHSKLPVPCHGGTIPASNITEITKKTPTPKTLNHPPLKSPTNYSPINLLWLREGGWFPIKSHSRESCHSYFIQTTPPLSHLFSLSSFSHIYYFPYYNKSIWKLPFRELFHQEIIQTTQRPYFYLSLAKRLN